MRYLEPSRRMMRRFHCSVQPLADSGQLVSVCLRRDLWKAEVEGLRVPGVWMTIYNNLHIADVESMVIHYIRQFVHQPWERGRRYE